MGLGTDLGLAVVYRIIKNHGGFIDVESRKDLGATFTIHLPALIKATKDKKSKPKKLESGKGTILIVDDEDMILDVSQQVLEKLGYSVLTTKNGEAALEMYAKQIDWIDAVILDMIMPGIGGGEVYERLKEINPDVIVLLSSGFSMDDTAKDMLEKGCRDFIQKPFHIKILSQKIKDVLASSKKRSPE
jgi:CheY-like chemotaxis protein